MLVVTLSLRQRQRLNLPVGPPGAARGPVGSDIVAQMCCDRLHTASELGGFPKESGASSATELRSQRTLRLEVPSLKVLS